MITKRERYGEIVAVLARHGIGIVDDQLIKHEAGVQVGAVHLRRACEELGAMFIKLGQMLSTRGDLLPDSYRTELAKLQDEVPPLSAEVIAGVIREDLGAPPDKLFTSFDPKPLGSASIGQVHAAQLFDGRDVVLKVRKPGVDELVKIDLEILGGIVDEWSPRFPILEQYDARRLVREFSDALRGELDYGREVANAKFFRDLLSQEQGFAIIASAVLVLWGLRSERRSETVYAKDSTIKVTEERTNELISYETVTLPPLKTHWEIYFCRGPEAGETEVREVMKVPLGTLGRAALALIGKFPAQEVASNLHRLKQLMETGRVTDTSYSVAGKFARR